MQPFRGASHMKHHFGTKAETLRKLVGQLPGVSVPSLLLFTVAQWRSAPNTVITTIQKLYPETTIIVRSSARNEDSLDQSHAGAYLSVGSVNTSDIEQIRQAIDSVIASYGTEDPENQFFIQEYLTDVAMSGVIFTRDLTTFAPYYVINFDTSGGTDGVTSGQSGSTQTVVKYRHAQTPYKSESIERVIALAAQLESLFGIDHLDIEFAFDKRGKLYLLQVRPLVKRANSKLPARASSDDQLEKLYKKIQKLDAAHPGIHGSRAIFSVMTDWNPAEMIGLRPKKLSLSLYKELITDSIWAYMRNNYGYRDVRSFPLLVSFLGCPYIDVRVSLNSFIPKALDDALAGKLVDYYTSELHKAPSDHDKVEFRIVFSCYYLNVNERLKKLLAHGFTELEIDRIKFALLELTNTIMHPTKGLYLEDLKKIEELDRRFHTVVQSDLHTIDKIYWLVEDCKRYGTLPFAGLARGGFIAVQLLRSMVECGIITDDDYQHLFRSFDTVTAQLSEQVQRYATGKISKDEFLAQFGHLRPGTYDIESLRYDEGFASYFGTVKAQEVAHEGSSRFSLTSHQMKQIEQRLIENGLAVTAEQFLSFIEEAIKGREYSKFVFTKNVSEILRLLAELGERFNFSREELAHLDIKTVLDLYAQVTSRGVDQIFADDIAKNRAEFDATRWVKLPQLITHEDDVYAFELGEVEPNFITQAQRTEVVILEEDLSHSSLEGKIVMIRSADPGYDWVFSKQIGGLVTMFGGANSHMAIRCAELGIPAVIGCGEQNFNQWAKARTLDIDCSLRQVKIIN
jgi:hypothetical protein